MKNAKLGMLILMTAVFFSACSSTPYDPTKPEMSVQERNAQPPRTFNQFHNEWEN